MYLRFDDQSWTNPGNALPVSFDNARFGRDAFSTRRWNVAAAATRMPSRLEPAPQAIIESRPPVAELPFIQLRGVRINSVSEQEAVQHIAEQWRVGRGGVVITPNLDHLRRCGSDHHFAALIEEADVVVADGMPLVWASRLQGTPLPQRVAGSNLIWSLSAAAASENKSVYLLGGAPGSADAAALVMRSRFRNLNVVGACCPAEGFENDPAVMNTIICELKSLQPDVVFVALGSPKQEKLIARLKPMLPQTWWLGVGISLSFVCGTVQRAPLWMQRVGLEWAHRLIQEPRRLFKRYIVCGLPFAAALLADSALRGVAGRILGLPPRQTTLRSRLDSSAAAVETQPEVPRNGPSTSKPSQQACSSVGPEAIAPRRARAVTPSLTARAEALVRRANELQTLAVPAAGRLRALVLLGGTVRQTPLSLSTGRSVLDLPLDERGSVLCGWLHAARSLAASTGLQRLPVRVTVNPTATGPTCVQAGQGIAADLRIERDASEYRGTGGVLHDVAIGYHDDDFILVANAAQVLLDPLDELLVSLQREAADVSLIAHDDGTPTGIMLVRCAALRSIAADGFVDMKEQALPRIALDFDVRVLYRQQPSGLPLRTLEDYILALRCHHRRNRMLQENLHSDTGAAPVDPLAEDWTSAFSLIEPGASVDPTARVHDSIVLAGSSVEGGAVLVRSVVCPGGIVRREKAAVDRFVTELSDREQRRDKRREPARNAAVGSQS